MRRSCPPHREAGDRNCSWLWRVGPGLRADELTPRQARELGCSGSGFLKLVRLDAPLSWQLVSAWRRLESRTGNVYKKRTTDSTREATGPAAAAAPVYILLTKWHPHHPSKILIGSSHPAPQRPCHAPRPCPARLRRVGGQVSAVTAAGRGSGIGRQLESPRNAPSVRRPVVTGGKGGLPAGLRLLFVPVSNLSVLLLEPPPSPLRVFLHLAPSVFPSPQTGFAASRPLPILTPSLGSTFSLRLSGAYEVLLLPPSACGSPSRELALPRPPWTTIPSEPSGRRPRLRSGDRVA